MNPEEHTEPRRFPEYDKVEFQLRGALAPMQWDPGKRTLSWVSPPEIPADYQAGWAEYLDFIHSLLNDEIGNHVPALAKVQRALYFDPDIAAGQVRVVEPYFATLPKGAIW